MKFSSPLQQGILIKRYKRFLCDVLLDDGSKITMHCPNTGSMKNCCPVNAPIWFSTSANPKRKYQHTWELLETLEGHKIGINSSQANHIVSEAIEQGLVLELNDYKNLNREVKYGQEKSRIDILLEHFDESRTYIEIKSVTLLEEDGWGYFPDSVSERGQKHLRELMWLVEQGHRAVLFFCIQHSGIQKMKPAAHIDSKYAELVLEAQNVGVEILAYACELNEHEIKVSQAIDFFNH